MRKRWLVGLVALAVVVGIVVARRHDLLRFVITAGASLASGYTVTISDQRIGATAMELDDVHVSHNGSPLLDAKRLRIRYSLRDVLPGSTRRFGLAAVDISNATVTIVKYRDGTYNFIIPQAGPPPVPQPHVIDQVPIRFDLRMHDASLVLLEPQAYDPSAKRVAVSNFNVDASIDTATVTRYRATGTFFERAAEPFTVRGTIDAVRNYALHRAQAPRFPLRALANYFADTPIVRILHGRARNFDARLYSFDVQPNMPVGAYHANLQLDVDGGTMAMSALDAPLENIRGHLQLVDNAFFLKRLDATLVGIPLQVTGGIYDLLGGLTGSAQLRLGIAGTGDLAVLKHAFAFTATQPISGRIALGVLVQGPIEHPMIVAKGRANRAVYQKIPFDALQADVIYRDDLLAFVPLHAYYSGTEVGVRGTMAIGKKLHSQLAVHVNGTAENLPYLDEMLGREPILLDAAATGDDLDFHVRGAAASARGTDRVAALVALEENGTGRVDPFWLHTSAGNFDGGYYLDRPDGDSGFWGVASGLRMHAPAHPTFPGIDLPAIPPIEGNLTSVALMGGGAGQHVAISGTFRGGRSSIAGVQFSHVRAAFSGTMADAQVNLLSATGPWGTFDGAGGFSTQAFVARGNYRGTFEGLQPFLGSAIPGHGALEGPATIAVEPKRILVQGDDLRMQHATLRGVPIDRASITLAVEGDRLRVYSAHAHAADGDIVAAGTYSLATSPPAGGAGTLSLVANRLSAAQLKGIGLPLEAGRLWATGDLSAGAPLPTFDGGVAIANGRVQQYAISGGGDVHLSGDRARLHRVVASLGTTYGLVEGTLGALSSGTPRYGLDARVPAGDVASALHALSYPNYMTQGTFNAHLAIGGTGLLPSVSGPIALPAGDVNGLPFVDASAQLSADPGGVAVRHGSVLVGTTHAQFDAIARKDQNEVHVVAPHADLSDFNNFFDTGDTLDGVGGLRVAFADSGGKVTTSGDLDIAGFRYRNLPIGDTAAQWSSTRNVIVGSLRVGGNQGMLRAKGSIAVGSGASLMQSFTDSTYDLSGEMSDLDLSLWVPALGFHNVPITGRVSGAATLRGRYPLIALRANANLAGGALGPLSLERATASLHSSGTRLVVDSAEMITSGLSATAAGSFGLRRNDALALTVHATTDDLPRLVYQLARVKVPVSGSFESTAQIGGTFSAPTFAAGFDADNVVAYGLTMSSLFGEVKLNGKSLVLSDAGATLGQGEVALAGSLPLQLSPLRIGPPNQPVSFDVNVTNVDPSVFDVVFGNNTKLGGTIDGHLGLSGTVGHPVIVGYAALAKGSYVSDLEHVPITAATATLTFNRTSASLTKASARLGNGTVGGSGSVSFGESGVSIVATGNAKGAQLDLPSYGSGSLDASLSLTKTPSTIALLAGSVTLNNATLPFAAFLNAANAAQAGGAGAGALPPVAFDLKASAGKNVRVRGSGYGAGLDIGATGSVRLAGTLASPKLDGSFTSTGGTLTYFDRAFRVQKAAVTFDPSAGILPTISAVANANVVNPDPDRVRNPYGSADISIAVNGPIDSLKIDFTTSPPGYTRDQIIAMLAPFGGFLNGIAFNNQSPIAVQSPGGFTPLGALSPIPNGVYQTHNGTITVGQEAFNILNAQFAAGLLSPLENALGQGLGLSSVNLTLGYYGNVGVTARRELGKAVSAVYSTTFGIPQIQSFGIQVNPNPFTAATLNFFYQTSQTLVYQTPNNPIGVTGNTLLGQPLQGNSGFSLTLQRFF